MTSWEKQLFRGSTENLDYCVVNGIWTFPPSASSLGVYGIVEVLSNTNGLSSYTWVMQKAHSVNGDIWIRQSINGNAWSTWRPFKTWVQIANGVTGQKTFNIANLYPGYTPTKFLVVPQSARGGGSWIKMSYNNFQLFEYLTIQNDYANGTLTTNVTGHARIQSGSNIGDSYSAYASPLYDVYMLV